MKLLLVFVSALVLVAHGNVTPSEEEDRAYISKPEVVAGYADDAGQETDGIEEPAIVTDPAPESGVYIPSITRACTNAACASICHQLGYKYGQCTSPSSCWCHN